MEINFQNIEQTFFLDQKVQDLLPEFRQQFDSWKISQMTPGLRPMGQKAIFDVMNGIEKKHLDILSEYFGEEIYVFKLNHKIVEHYNFDIDEHDNLCRYNNYKDFCLTRSKNEISVTFWR